MSLMTGAYPTPPKSWARPPKPFMGARVARLQDQTAGIVRDPGRIEVPLVRVTGTRVATFGQDWFDRIHINYTELALGNLVGEQIRQVKIWNAYQQAKRLDSIGMANTDGILLYGQPDPPLYFAAQEQKSWNLRVSTSGPPVINATYTFTFADGTVRVLHISGTRIIAWATIPNWEKAIVQRFEWLTDVLQARSGKEQRRQLRIGARSSLEFDVMATGDERRLMEATLFGWGGRVWAVPIWPDGVDLPTSMPAGTQTVPIDPSGLDFHNGGIAILIADNNNFEIVEIATVQPGSITLTRPTTKSWAASQVLFPARTARIDGSPKFSNFDGETSYGSIRFALDEPIDHEELPAEHIYRGWPVLTEAPNWINDPATTYDRNLETLDGSTGAVIVNDPSGLPALARSHTWLLADRADRRAVMGVLAALHGRGLCIWVPTFCNDLVLAGLVQANATSIDVEFTAYVSQLNTAEGRRDIMIVLRDGTLFFRRIIQSQSVDDSTERLSIDTPLGVQVDIGDVVQICFMMLARNDADALELSHWTGETSEITVNWRGFNNDQ